MKRLDKLIADTGKWSRKEAKVLVKEGRVRVAGEIPKGPEDKVEPGILVTVDGHPLSTETFLYLMLHKPAGVISSTEDPREETVLSLLPKEYRNRALFPVGRLDKDTEGLLLLTNDGQLAHQLLSPAKHVDKVYYAEVDGILEESDREVFREGVLLKDGTKCRPAELEILEEPNQCLVTLWEGKYHQVKRMLASRGKPVLYLKRLSMGSIKLDKSLQKGAFRPLFPKELEHLFQILE